MKRIGKQITKLLFTVLIISFVSCTKDDDMGMKVPTFNKQAFNVSHDISVKDSIFEMYKQPFHILSLAIVDKNNENILSWIDFKKQEQNTIIDEAGNQLGEVKYGKNDVLEINIYNFCTLKRQMDSEKGKMYIITPSANKRDDIYISLSMMLDKGIGCGVEIH